MNIPVSSRVTATGMLNIRHRPSQDHSTDATPGAVVSGEWWVVSRSVTTHHSPLTTHLFEPADNERDILSAKAEAVAQHVTDALLARDVRDIVQVTIRIGRLVVDGRRQ